MHTIDHVYIKWMALEKLKLYIEICPGEICGIGFVSRGEGIPVIENLFLVHQEASLWETKLDTGALFNLLENAIKDGLDPWQIRVWWHSHAIWDLSWSETDESTIDAFPVDWLISIVGNKRGEHMARIDWRGPVRKTINDVKLIGIGERDYDMNDLRKEVMRDIDKKVLYIYPHDGRYETLWWG